MTVSSAIAVATLNWTGVETQFTPGFQALETGDVSVIFAATARLPAPTQTLTLNTNFSVTLDGAGNVTVGVIAFPAPPGTITISRNSTPLQADAFQDGVPWSATVIEEALDLSTLRDQELRRDLTAAQASIAAETARAETAEAALWAAVGPALAQLSASLLTSLQAQIGDLPTALPALAGVFWNNGQVVCVTPGGTLPTTKPGTPGILWDNGGVVCISS